MTTGGAGRPRRRNTRSWRDPVRARPLTPKQLARGIVQIKPEDVKKINASKPGKGDRAVKRK
jgi:hypothetical protein